MLLLNILTVGLSKRGLNPALLFGVLGLIIGAAFGHVVESAALNAIRIELADLNIRQADQKNENALFIVVGQLSGRLAALEQEAAARRLLSDVADVKLGVSEKNLSRTSHSGKRANGSPAAQPSSACVTRDGRRSRQPPTKGVSAS